MCSVHLFLRIFIDDVSVFQIKKKIKSMKQNGHNMDSVTIKLSKKLSFSVFNAINQLIYAGWFHLTVNYLSLLYGPAAYSDIGPNDIFKKANFIHIIKMFLIGSVKML